MYISISGGSLLGMGKRADPRTRTGTCVQELDAWTCVQLLQSWRRHQKLHLWPVEEYIPPVAPDHLTWHRLRFSVMLMLSCRFSEPGCSEELIGDTNEEMTLILNILWKLLGCCLCCWKVCMYVYSVCICVPLPWLVVKNTTASHTYGSLTENNTETTSSFGFSLF